MFYTSRTKQNALSGFYGGIIEKQMNKTEPIYQKRDVEEFLRILNAWNKNYYIAAMIGIHWGLRISDIIALEIGRFVAGTAKRIQVPNMILVTEIKTGRERHITVTPNMKKVLKRATPATQIK